jgi:putative transcriptional regulator
MKNNVAEARAPKGWIQVELADAVNVTTACINAVEHGRYDPTLILAYDIAEALALISLNCFRRSLEGRPKKAPPRSPGICACFRFHRKTR